MQVEFKKTYKLRSTEDAFVALEDNTVTLSTMKASKFFVVFEEDITKWERTLALVSETIEMIQQVQRNWQYLESIFVGSEDIRKQLPQVCLAKSLLVNAIGCLLQRNGVWTLDAMLAPEPYSWWLS